ncbi:MAG: monovalent cation/H(+) antiporter subunit G [Anaerolineales bacterium]|nr:monovalent cation/H(+) antiporter subunit G [Anaerolineales bacterium]
MMPIISGTFLIFGSILLLIAGVGIVRMPDLFLRMSASTKAATLGTGLILLGAVFHFETTIVLVRAVLIIAFIFLTAPVSAHMIGRAAYRGEAKLDPKTHINELQGMYDVQTHKAIES